MINLEKDGLLDVYVEMLMEGKEIKIKKDYLFEVVDELDCLFNVKVVVGVDEEDNKKCIIKMIED